MRGGEMATHVAGPALGSAPVVLLLPAIFGVTKGIEEFGQRIAQNGYTVVAPDMFWRTAPGPLGYEGADRDKAQERYRAFDAEGGSEDVGALITWAKQNGASKVGVVGLCFGGRYALLACTRHSADAGVSYHGTYLERHLDEFAAVRAPLSLHFGESDPHTPISEVERMRQAARDNPRIEIHTYEGAGHGFMQHDRPSYHAAAAELAFERGMRTLRAALASGGDS